MTTQPEPRRRDPEARRRAILTAAAELVTEAGAAALTHRAVAARAGVALGSTTKYFTSIDELREAALGYLAAEIDRELAEAEVYFADIRTAPENAVAELHRFLCDRRAVHATIALLTSGTTDPSLRALARRWDDRFIEFLTGHIGSTRATAIAVYLDGVTMHAGLNETPVAPESLLAVIRALVAMPDPDDTPTTG